MSDPQAHVGQYSADQAVGIARKLVCRGLYDLTPRAAGQLAELLDSLGRAGQNEQHEALEAIVHELDASHYRPPRNPEPVPGIPFIWVSSYFGRELYFKFKLVGPRRKLRMVVYSCHPPDFRKDID